MRSWWRPGSTVSGRGTAGRKRQPGHLHNDQRCRPKLVLDEFSDQRHGAFRCIGDYGVPAIREPFELNEARRQRRCNISLALDWMHRIVFAAQHEGRTLNAIEIGDMLKVWLSPPGFANQRSPTSGFRTVRLPTSGSRGVRV